MRLPEQSNRCAEILLFTTRMGIGIVLLFSSTLHLANPYQLYSSILAYEILSESIALFATAVLPFLQLLVAVFLVLDFLRPAPAMIATTMFLVFFAAQMTAMSMGIQISCGCFGARSAEIGIVSILEVVLLSGASFTLSVFQNRSEFQSKQTRHASVSIET